MCHFVAYTQIFFFLFCCFSLSWVEVVGFTVLPHLPTYVLHDFFNPLHNLGGGRGGNQGWYGWLVGWLDNLT